MPIRTRSIVSDEKECFLCGSQRMLELHHIFGGAYRKKSDRLGLVVWLCHGCHNEPPNGVHHNSTKMLQLKRIGQMKAMEHFGWDISEFRNQFSKNYFG